MHVGFIGVGKLGMPCAEEIAKKGHDVCGYDVADVDSDLVNVVPTIADVVADRDIVFIAVPTPHDPDYDGRAPSAHLEPRDFDYSIVKDVMSQANAVMNSKQLLVLISTVLPGTVRRDLAPLVTNTRFVYNPYLIAMGSVGWDMVNPEMVMIGTDDGSETGDAKQLVDFYKTIMENNPRYEIGTWDECECIKVFYNTFISAKIGLVNMIQDVAERQGNINVDVVTHALAHSTKRIMGPQYMTAGIGDGGGCVKPDFKVIVDSETLSMEKLFNRFHNMGFAECDLPPGPSPATHRKDVIEAIKNGRNMVLPTYLVKSMNWSGTDTDQKKIADVTKREYTGKMYTFTTNSGKTISVTEDHLVPVERDRKRIVIPAKEVKKTDKLYIFG